MVVHTVDRLPALYQQDETAWLDEMAALIREGRIDALDFPNLGEYLADMARRDRREVKSRLTLLMAHLLKWTHQPARRTGNWRATIEVQRQELVDLIESATLRHHAEETLAKAYVDGLRQAAAETGMPTTAFPAECPYSLTQLEGLDLLVD